jgi:thiol-disulfide isomerase/thioredoxin
LKRFWSRLLVVVASLVFLAAFSALAFFKWAESRVGSRLQPPELHLGSQAVPNLPFRTLDGKLHSVSEFKGKVVFLDLWGTWCIQCVAEMPTVQRLYNHYRNDPGVVFLIVSRLDSPSAVQGYARRHHFDLPFYVTRDEDVPDSMYLHQLSGHVYLRARWFDGSPARRRCGLV